VDEKQSIGVLEKLDKILKLLTMEAVKGLPKEQDKIAFLDSLEFKSSDIDRLLGKSPGYSSVVLSQLKKKKQPKASVDSADSSASQEVLT